MKLIDEAGKWYRMFSVQMLVLVGAVQSVLMVLTPEQAAQLVPFMGTMTWHSLGVALTVGAAILGAIGRLIKQDSVSGT